MSARPSFTRVVGQERAKEDLDRGLRADRLVGSFLITGPAGTGRALLARELAKAWNCRAGEGPLPCGECLACRKIERGAHTDVAWVTTGDKASIGIDRVKEVLDELAMAPVEGRRRVFCFDPASALTEDAQNALLKGLEEPPARASLVLIAVSEDDLLKTIVSRCRVVRADELNPDAVREVLRAHDVPEDEAAARARWAGGSPGRALADGALHLGETAERALGALAGGAAYADPFELVEALAAYVDRDKADTAARRARLSELIGTLARALRDALVLRVDPAGLERGQLSGAGRDVLGALAALPPGRLEAALGRLSQAEEELTQNVNPTLLVEGLAVDLGGRLAPPRATRARPAGARS